MALDPTLGFTIPVPGNPGVVQQINDALAIIAGAAGASKAGISGLQLEWLSTTGIRVKTGVCTTAAGTVLTLTADKDKTGLTIGASTWYHVYLYNNAGVIDAEVVTTAPVAYFGTAYQKTGDTSRRYLGSVKSTSGSALINFLHVLPGFMRYRADIGSTPLLVLSNGTATTATDIDCSAVVPSTSRLMSARLANTSASALALFGTSDGITPTTTVGSSFVAQAGDQVDNVPLNSSGVCKYIYSAAPTNGLYVSVLGYYFER